MNLCSSWFLKLNCLRWKYISAKINHTMTIHCTEPRYSTKRHRISQDQNTCAIAIIYLTAKILRLQISYCTEPSCNIGIALHKVKVHYRHYSAHSQKLFLSLNIYRVKNIKKWITRKSVWCILVSEKFTGTQMFKKPRRFITVFTNATHWTSFWPRAHSTNSEAHLKK